MPTPGNGIEAATIGNSIFVMIGGMGGGSAEPDIWFAKVNEIFPVVNWLTCLFFLPIVN